MQKFSYQIRMRSYVKGNGCSALILRVSCKEGIKDLPTYIDVPANNWCKKQRQVKAGKGLTKTKAGEINLQIAKFLDKMEVMAVELRQSAMPLNINLIERRYHVIEQPFELLAYYRQFLDENPRNLAAATLRMHRDSYKHLQQCYPEGLVMDELKSVYERLEKHLANRKLCLNTRRKHHKQVKSILKRASEHDNLIIENPYRNVTLGIIKGVRTFLELEELERCLDFCFKQKLPYHLQNALEQFLFAALTGLRISDMHEVHQGNLVGGELHFYAVKTQRYDVKIEAPIPEVARPLIQRKVGKLFNMRDDQVTNRNIKEAMRWVGLKKDVSFHCARHTYATLYIALGGSVRGLQELLQHSKIDTTMVYVHLAERMNLKKQRLFDDHFGGKYELITKSRVRVV